MIHFLSLFDHITAHCSGPSVQWLLVSNANLVWLNNLFLFSSAVSSINFQGDFLLEKKLPAMNKKVGNWAPTSSDQVICSFDADLLMADVAFKTALSLSLNHLKRKEPPPKIPYWIFYQSFVTKRPQIWTQMVRPVDGLRASSIVWVGRVGSSHLAPDYGRRMKAVDWSHHLIS